MKEKQVKDVTQKTKRKVIGEVDGKKIVTDQKDVREGEVQQLNE